MTDKNREETQAFAQKMQEEGAAGFAAGLTPWNSWDDFEEPAGSRQVWRGTAQHVAAPKIPQRNFGDRVLATMTALTIATLFVGIAGVFLTQQPALQIAENNARLPSTGPSGDLSIDQEVSPALLAILAEDENLFTALDELPAPAADTGNPWSTTLSEPVADEKMENPGINTAEAEINTPVQPTKLSGTSMPDMDTELMQNDTWDTSKMDELEIYLPILPATLSRTSTPDVNTKLMQADTRDIREIDEPEIYTPVQSATLSRTSTPDVSTELMLADTRDISEMDEPEIYPPVQSATMSRTSMPDVSTELMQADTRDISENEQSVVNDWDWSINIASYLKESTAEKMQQRFLDKGVATDLVTATVKGKTYYRLRVTEFETRKDATAHSAIIKELLGIEEVWITKE